MNCSECRKPLPNSDAIRYYGLVYHPGCFIKTIRMNVRDFKERVRIFLSVGLETEETGEVA